MARSGINIRVKKNNRMCSLDVVYDLGDDEFKDWVNSKLDYHFSPRSISTAERYSVIEDMQDQGIQLYVDPEIIAAEDWWLKNLEKTTDL